MASLAVLLFLCCITAVLATAPTTHRAAGCFDTSYSTEGSFYTLRDLPDLTPLVCLEHCVKRGFLVSGTTGGFLCQCSDFVDRRALLKGDQSRCDIECIGDVSQVCGGTGVTSVLVHSSFPIPLFPVTPVHHADKAVLALFIPIPNLKDAQAVYSMYKTALTTKYTETDSGADTLRQHGPAHTYATDLTTRFVTSSADPLTTLAHLKQHITDDTHEIYIWFRSGKEDSFKGEVIDLNRALQMSTLLLRETIHATALDTPHGQVQVIRYNEFTLLRMCKFCGGSLYFFVLPLNMELTRFPEKNVISRVKQFLQVSYVSGEENPLDAVTVEWDGPDTDLYPLVGRSANTQFCSMLGSSYLVQHDRECVGVGFAGISSLGLRQARIAGVSVRSKKEQSSIGAPLLQFPLNVGFSGTLLTSSTDDVIPLLKTINQTYNLVKQHTNLFNMPQCSDHRIISCSSDGLMPFASASMQRSLDKIIPALASHLALHEDIITLYRMITSSTDHTDPLGYIASILRNNDSLFPFLAQYPIKPSLHLREFGKHVQVSLNLLELLRPLYYALSFSLAELGRHHTSSDPDLARVIFLCSHALYHDFFPVTKYVLVPQRNVISKYGALLPFVSVLQVEDLDSSKLTSWFGFALYKQPSMYYHLPSLVPSIFGAYRITDMLLSMPKEDIHEVQSRRDELIDLYAEQSAKRVSVQFPSGGMVSAQTKYSDVVVGTKYMHVEASVMFPANEQAVMVGARLYSLYEAGYRDAQMNRAASRATATDWVNCADAANTALLYEGHARALYFSKQCTAYRRQALKRLAAAQQQPISNAEQQEQQAVQDTISTLYSLTNSSLVSLGVLTIIPMLLILIRIVLPFCMQPPEKKTG